jgi:alpha-L-rhamnosidase
MWERWDAWTHEKGFNDTGMNSFNHYAYGAVGEWMYAVVAGIDLDARQAGYKRIHIRPTPGGGLTRASATLETGFGRVESAWRIENGTMHVRVVIPPNTTAVVDLPTTNADDVTENGEAAARSPGVRLVQAGATSGTFEVGAGEYSFVVRAPVIQACG